MKPLKSILALSLAAVVLFSLSACKQSEPNGGKPVPDPVTSTPNQTSPQTPSNPFSEAISGLRSKINYVGIDQIKPAEDSVQQQLLADMAALVKAKKPSAEVFSTFEKGVVQLSPEHATQYAAMALSVLRKNSFEDYKPYEDFFGAMPGSERQNAFYEKAKAAGYNYYDLKQASATIEDPDLLQIFQQAKAQGYLLVSAEGMIFPIVDYTEFAKYNAAYTKDFAALMDQEAFGCIEILVSDAALIVPVELVSALALEADRQLSEVPEGKYKDYLAMNYADYLRMLFFGTDNTPMYDYETGKLREEVAVLYKRLAAMTGTKTADYVTMQMGILEDNDGKYDDGTRDKINGLLDKVLKDYEVTEQRKNDYYSWMSGESY